MKQIVAYLQFAGNCREAMNFYKECFGGELVFNTVKGSPMEQYMKPEDQDKILHSSLTNGTIQIFASEMAVPKTIGDNVHLWVNCASEAEIETLFNKLSKGGKITIDLMPAYWGATFGAVTDKYGIQWYVSKM